MSYASYFFPMLYQYSTRQKYQTNKIPMYILAILAWFTSLHFLTEVWKKCNKKTIKFLNRFCLQLHNNDYFSRVYEKVANFRPITLQKVENKQIQAHNYNLSYLLFAFDYIKLSLRLLQGSCFTQTDVNYCFISFLDDDSCARKTGKNNTYKHNWVELFTNWYSCFDATVFSRTTYLFRWHTSKRKKVMKTQLT